MVKKTIIITLVIIAEVNYVQLNAHVKILIRIGLYQQILLTHKTNFSKIWLAEAELFLVDGRNDRRHEKYATSNSGFSHELKNYEILFS